MHPWMHGRKSPDSIQGPESSAWRGQPLVKLKNGVTDLILSMNVFRARKIRHRQTPGWSALDLSEILIHMQTQFRSKMEPWNCLYLCQLGYTSKSYVAGFEFGSSHMCAPIWHRHFVFESLLAAHLAHQLVEIWMYVCMSKVGGAAMCVVTEAYTMGIVLTKVPSCS